MNKTVATIKQIFLHTRSHANVSLFHTVTNAVLANSESHALNILNMAKLGFHYLQLHIAKMRSITVAFFS